MSTINNEVLALRKSGGYFSLADFAVVEITGADAARFLQTRLSNDVLALQPGQGQMTGLLDRKAHVLAYGSLHRLGSCFWLLLEAKQVPAVIEQIEQFRFREQVEFRTLTDWHLWSIQGAKSALFLSSGIENHSAPVGLSDYDLAIFDTVLYKKPVVVIRRSLTGEPGLIIGSSKLEPSFEHDAGALNMVPIGSDARNIARVEAGEPAFGIDFDIEQLLPETGLEQVAVSYTKGCFQGQEVLARIKSFGAPRRGLVGLMFDETLAAAIPLSAIVYKDGAEIGEIRSNVYSPTIGRHIALAYVLKEYRVPDQQFGITIAERPYRITVVSLPFYSAATKKQRANKLYQSALHEFACGSEVTAIAMLREVIDLDPLFADAYESLGVVLSRHDQLDEAIAIMKRLEQLNPESIMAHTNLSVFYMQQGNKEAAEDEKAKAMSMRMTLLARDMAGEQKKQEEVKKRKEAAQERMSMFAQVLAIDSDDFLANSGLGSAYIDAERHEEAIPYLQNALKVRPNHTVAYLFLGEAYEKLGRTKEAIDTYKQGVATAAKRGDGEPMKEMRQRLQKLAAGNSQD